MRELFEGVLTFSGVLLADADVCGETFTGRAGGIDFAITLPVIPDGPLADVPSLAAPPIANPKVDINRSWGYAALQSREAGGEPRVRQWAIERAYFRAEFDLDEQVEHSAALAASNFGGALNVWWETALTWVEMWTGQVLTEEPGPDTTISGTAWTVAADTDSRKLTGWGHSFRVAVQRDEVRLTAAILRAAFHRADRAEQPPLEWILHFRAQRRNDLRLRVIEAATAAEVALARAVDRRLPATTSAARERIVKNTNGVAGLIRLVQDLDGVDDPHSVQRVIHRLSGPRNDAAHAGIAPDRETMSLAIEEARRVLDQYSPMPTYSDDRTPQSDLASGKSRGLSAGPS